MNFLYPQLLFGLLALSIPIIVHLFNFRRTKKVYFSNTRFLKKVKEASSSKLRIKHYLILLSRLLFIFFLVMAFAQPYLPSTKDGFVSNQVAIYLDNSYSMSNEADDNLSAFDLSIGFINKLIGLYPNSTKYKLITNDLEAASNSYKSGTEISELLTEQQMTGVTRTTEEINDRIQLDTETVKPDVFWLSDFQSSTLGKDHAVLDSTMEVNLVPLQFTSVNNVFIDSIYLDNPFLIGDQQLKLNVIVSNKGAIDRNDMNIKVFIDDLQAATATVGVKANDFETITFDLSFNSNKWSKGKISIEDFPVTFDNDFYFVFNNSRKINVLEVHENNHGRYIQSVFGNDRLFNFTSQSVDNLDYNLVRQSDLVVVNSLTAINGPLAETLNGRVLEGGQIFIVPTEEIDINSYKLVNGLQFIEMAEDRNEMSLTTPDFDNPFFANIFEERNQRVVMPKANPLLNLGSDRNALLNFTNGQTYLNKINQGIYILASPLTNEFNTLQNHALFLPIVYRMAVSSSKDIDRLYYSVDDDYVSMQTDTLLADNVFKLSSEQGEFIPSQRLNNKSVLLEIPKNELEAGYYDVKISDEIVTTLAFNNSPKESDLRQAPVDDLNQYFQGKYEVISAADEASFSKAVESKYIGQPLWKYAIMLALLFLLIEVLLIRFFP
ncbi:BatA domain-containing protein [Fulvivirga sp.]|uniref:BatA domain-containing protein n=1 Tax=Fulvivirga sp. TaxID=1931237 RepID=UPI0032ECC517